MKLSEMNTQQLAKCLCEIAGPISRIGQNPKIEAAMRKRAQETGEQGKTVVSVASAMIGDMVPVVLGTCFEDVLTIVSAMTGKSVEEIRAQPGMQTIADVRDMLDRDFFDFFNSSAASEQTK